MEHWKAQFSNANYENDSANVIDAANYVEIHNKSLSPVRANRPLIQTIRAIMVKGVLICELNFEK